uniref:Putative LAGLIDADG homing endonuclease n=1 Tax=Sykidion marinum TaxID=44573 RepID=A0A1W6EGM2_SYKMA|nr:putative LAGLIDADG homing endonuclease [Pseudoneochloris marina]ARK14540.1 putative LAGLIDADG homing endonuclease [Pseudoneochloris marina]
MTQLKKLLPEQLAYIAGFLDGDGCINAQIVKRPDYKLKYQIRVSITFFQKTKSYWFLIKLKKLLGCGTLRQRPDHMSEYTIVGPSNVENILVLLKPYVLLKQPQLNVLLELIKQMPKVKNDPLTFLKLCEQVDRFIVLNNSKKRQITAETVRSDLGLTTNLFPVETETKSKLS